MERVILDIDSAGDDILAVLYMALNPQVKLEGVTTVTGASGDIVQATWVALNTLELAGSKVPVYAGCEKPLAEKKEAAGGDPVNFDEELRWKFGSRLDLFNMPAQRPGREAGKQSAVDFILERINQNPGEITLVTTGPLTNVARAIEKDASVASKVKEAYVLGGSFHVPGNMTPVTEYNIRADAEAAKIVFNSDMRITLVPLDVCENNAFADGMLTRDHLADIQAGSGGRTAEYLADVYPIYIDLWREYFGLGGFPMDDVITAALSVNPELCRYTERIHVDVELEGELTRGQTIAFEGRQINKYPEREHKNTRIANYLYGKRFMDRFVRVIAGGDKKA